MRGFVLYALVLLGTFLTLKPAYGAITIRPMLNTGLVGYWSMDEGYGTAAYDQSGYRNNGTIYSSTTPAANWASGQLGKALNFDGADDYVNVGGNNSILNITGDQITLSSWIKITSATTSPMGIFAKYGSSIGYRYLVNSSDNLTFQLGIGAGNPTLNSSAVLSINTWYHVVAVYDGSKMKIYIDGQKDVNDADQTGNIGTSSSAALWLGHGDDSLGQGTSYPFGGIVDEIRIYNRALSSGEVKRLYNLTKPKIKALNDNGLVGYWALDEGQGTIARDSSGKGNHGTASGSPAWVNGKRGKALSFDSDSVNAGSSASINDMSYITASAWIYPADLSAGSKVIVAKINNALDDNGWSFGLSSSGPGRLYFKSIYEGALNQVYRRSVDNVLQADAWNFVTVSWDGSSNYSGIHIYVNGSEVSYSYGTNASGNRDSDISSSLIMGSNVNATASFFQGNIDEVRIYNRALSAGEVSTLYTASKKIMKLEASQNNKLTTGLVGLWSFNGPDISGVTAFDRSGQNNHGTISGATPTMGKVGQALKFDGSGDYVAISGSSSIDDLATATISMWFKVSDDGSLLIKDEADSGSLNIYTYPDRRLQLTRKYGNPPLARVCAAGSFQFNRWTHLAAVYAGRYYSDAHIYIDGAECAYGGQSDGVGSFSSEAGTTLKINSNNWPTVGSLDEVRIYNRALSASEIQRLYNMGR